MKKLFLILTIAVGLTACRKDLTSLRPITPTSSTSTSTIPVKNYQKWKVTNLVRNNINETSDFTGSIFQFAPNGIIYATRNGKTFTGNWTSRTENNQQKLNITFNGGGLLELANNWDLILRDDQVIKLQAITKEDVTEYLDFHIVEVNP